MVKEFRLVYEQLFTKGKVLFAFTLILILALDIFFIRNRWKSSVADASEDALKYANVAAVAFHKTAFDRLDTESWDVKSSVYTQIRDILATLVTLNDHVRFAYIYIQKNGKIVYIEGSESLNSQDTNRPSKEFIETNPIFLQPYQDGKTHIVEPRDEKLGKWTNVLVPITEGDPQKIIAVLGVDYISEDWDKTETSARFDASFLALYLFLILISFHQIIFNNVKLREEKNKLSIVRKKLETNEALFRTVFEQSPIGIAIGDKSRQIFNTNLAFEKITGRSQNDLLSMNGNNKQYSDELIRDLYNLPKREDSGNKNYSIEKRYVKPGGYSVWVNLLFAPLQISNQTDTCHLYLLEDISERKHAETALKENEQFKSLLLKNLPGVAYRCFFDHDWTMQFISNGCLELTGYTSESLLFNQRISYNELIHPDYRKLIWDLCVQAIESKTSFNYEYPITTASGEIKWVWEQGQGITDENGNVVALEGLIIDMTERKKREEEVQYIGEHDFLTGLYNRRFFEQELMHTNAENFLPLSIIVGDINGVKLINDAFGHAQGDKLIIETAKVLQSCCREEDVLARVGGDEFNLLLPKTDSLEAHAIYKNIKKACEEFNKTIMDEISHINISLGYSTKESSEESSDIVIKKAEDYMYKRKLLEHKSAHSSIISTIKATMIEKSQETEDHEERLVLLSKKIGNVLNLAQIELDKLELLAMLHDIGKVVIDDRILIKQDKLTEEEWVIMKKHPEIGYRIAMSVLELVPIAEFILYHHERWDGNGYPEGLKGEEIPLLSRIVALADSYDAMTHDRPYRKAMTRDEAILEINSNAGTQFDPNIAAIFLKILSAE